MALWISWGSALCQWPICPRSRAEEGKGWAIRGGEEPHWGAAPTPCVPRSSPFPQGERPYPSGVLPTVAEPPDPVLGQGSHPWPGSRPRWVLRRLGVGVAPEASAHRVRCGDPGTCPTGPASPRGARRSSPEGSGLGWILSAQRPGLQWLEGASKDVRPSPPELGSRAPAPASYSRPVLRLGVKPCASGWLCSSGRDRSCSPGPTCRAAALAGGEGPGWVQKEAAPQRSGSPGTSSPSLALAGGGPGPR